jgi:uncharacterized coiled-coil protein SlyX
MPAKQRKSTIAASPEVSSALAIYYIFCPIKFHHEKTKMAAWILLAVLVGYLAVVAIVMTATGSLLNKTAAAAPIEVAKEAFVAAPGSSEGAGTGGGAGSGVGAGAKSGFAGAIAEEAVLVMSEASLARKRVSELTSKVTEQLALVGDLSSRLASEKATKEELAAGMSEAAKEMDRAARAAERARTDHTAAVQKVLLAAEEEDKARAAEIGRSHLTRTELEAMVADTLSRLKANAPEVAEAIAGAKFDIGEKRSQCADSAAALEQQLKTCTKDLGYALGSLEEDHLHQLQMLHKSMQEDMRAMEDRLKGVDSSLAETKAAVEKASTAALAASAAFIDARSLEKKTK